MIFIFYFQLCHHTMKIRLAQSATYQLVSVEVDASENLLLKIHSGLIHGSFHRCQGKRVDLYVLNVHEMKNNFRKVLTNQVGLH
jgi:hypothetical protein